MAKKPIRSSRTRFISPASNRPLISYAIEFGIALEGHQHMVGSPAVQCSIDKLATIRDLRGTDVQLRSDGQQNRRQKTYSLVPPYQILHINQFCRLLFGCLTTTVVTGCSLEIGATGRLLCRRDVRTGIEQIADERAP
jgi:hypothetical protein